MLNYQRVMDLACGVIKHGSEIHSPIMARLAAYHRNFFPGDTGGCHQKTFM